MPGDEQFKLCRLEQPLNDKEAERNRYESNPGFHRALVKTALLKRAKEQFPGPMGEGRLDACTYESGGYRFLVQRCMCPSRVRACMEMWLSGHIFQAVSVRRLLYSASCC
jgi:hypothetical protein